MDSSRRLTLDWSPGMSKRLSARENASPRGIPVVGWESGKNETRRDPREPSTFLPGSCLMAFPRRLLLASGKLIYREGASRGAAPSVQVGQDQRASSPRHPLRQSGRLHYRRLSARASAASLLAVRCLSVQSGDQLASIDLGHHQIGDAQHFLANRSAAP
jgi:hypothetical protein